MKRTPSNITGRRIGASVENQKRNPDSFAMVMFTAESSSGVVPYAASVSGSPCVGSFIAFLCDPSAYARVMLSPATEIFSTFPARTSFATWVSEMVGVSLTCDVMSEYALISSRKITMVVTKFPKKPGPLGITDFNLPLAFCAFSFACFAEFEPPFPFCAFFSLEFFSSCVAIIP